MRQFFAAILIGACICGCATQQTKSRDTLTQYLNSHAASPKGEEGLCLSISNVQTVFGKILNGVPQASVTFDLTIQTGPDGPVINSSHYTYVLNEIRGKWTVVESRVRTLDGKWLNQGDFHRERDPVFADLPWCIKQVQAN